MLPVQVDPHPTCARCRGRNCTSDSTCSTCEGWSLGQWESFNKKRSYAGRKKSSKRHAGDPTSLASKTTCSVAPRKQATTSHMPLPSPHPLSEGQGMGKEMDCVNPKHTRVSSSSPHPTPRGGRQTMSCLRGEPPPLSPSEEGERMDTVPPQPSPIVYKALLSPRPKGHESHPYLRSDIRGERGESQPLSPPLPTPDAY